MELKFESQKRRSPAALEWRAGLPFGKLAFERLGGHQGALLVFVSRYGETPILCRIGGHDTLAIAIATEAAPVSGTQNLSQTLGERG